MSREDFMKLTDQQKWDEHCLLQSELDSVRNHNRPKEGNAILRIDLELPVEEINGILKRQAFRTSVELAEDQSDGNQETN